MSAFAEFTPSPWLRNRATELAAAISRGEVGQCRHLRRRPDGIAVVLLWEPISRALCLKCARRAKDPVGMTCDKCGSTGRPGCAGRAHVFSTLHIGFCLCPQCVVTERLHDGGDVA